MFEFSKLSKILENVHDQNIILNIKSNNISDIWEKREKPNFTNPYLLTILVRYVIL